MTSGKKVLVTQNIEFFQTRGETFFRREGLELLVARDGCQACDLIARERPGLVFMEFTLPEMRGDECCRRIKSDPSLRHIPVVLVTQDDRKENLRLCLQAQSDYIVFKPLTQHDFLALARKFLGLAERKTDRASVRLPVLFGQAPSRLRAGCSINLSTGGLYIATEDPPDAAKPLILEFSLPARGRKVRCRSTVAWRNSPGETVGTSLPPGFGVRFLLLAPAQIRAIRALMAENSPIASE